MEKASSKLNALDRLTPHMKFEKNKIILNSFFNAQSTLHFFGCCIVTPAIIIRSSICICLRLLCSDKKSSYKTLLEKDGSVSINHKNIQTLATEIFKVTHHICPEITGNIFIEGTNCLCNLRYRKHFKTPREVSTMEQSIEYLGPKI